MQKITSATELKNAIQQLEYKQANEWPILKEHFQNNYESFRPINIIKHTFKEVISSPDLRKDVINTAIGYTAGIVVKKVLLAKINNPFTKLAGVALEMMVAGTFTKNAEGIELIGGKLLEKIKKFGNSKIK